MAEATPLQHLATHYSDQSVARDMDAVYAAVRTQAEIVVAEEYAKARRKASGYRPGTPGSSNHRLLGSGWADLQGLADQLAYVEPDGRTDALRRLVKSGSRDLETTCEECGTPFAAARASAQYCSRRCARRHQRAKAEVA